MTNYIIEKIIEIVQHYNHKKYWEMRNLVVSPNKGNFLTNIKKLWFLFLIKRMDAFNNASLGTHYGYGAQFKNTPLFKHGIRGIFISHNAYIGANAIIYHQVTIGEGNGGAPRIGDDCYIGAGAKIIGNIIIGNNVKIGANCIVCEDIPDNCTVVMNKPRIIKNNNDKR